MEPDPSILPALVKETMPFGKYKGVTYDRIPVSYLEWLSKKGFPAGRTGMLLSTVYEIRLNGLEFILRRLKTGN